jgi:hypothetical protein
LPRANNRETYSNCGSAGFTVKKPSPQAREFGEILCKLFSSFNLVSFDEVQHSHMRLAGIQGMFGLDSR